MENVILCYENNTIIITKKFAREASDPKSTAYAELKTLREENPGFTVVVRQTNKKATANNRITYKTMENYIAKHDKTGEIMKKFLEYKNEEAGENLEKTSFFKVKKWFFETYPELKNVA